MSHRRAVYSMKNRAVNIEMSREYALLGRVYLPYVNNVNRQAASSRC